MGRTENRLRSPVPVQRKISLNICSGIWHCMVERCESPVAVSNPVPATAQMQLTEPQQDELERCARSRSVADEAMSDVRRQSANDWYDHSLSSRLNDKRTGCIILIMQRLHEDDLTGHSEKSGEWRILRLPAIAEEDEVHLIASPYGVRTVNRSAGEALDPVREPLEILEKIRATQGEYNFAGQYQQAPAPLGGGLVKIGWFQHYDQRTLPLFDLIFQSWDTANKTTELSDFSVCTTWGVKLKQLYLLHVLRKKMGYPDLKRAVCE